MKFLRRRKPNDALPSNGNETEMQVFKSHFDPNGMWTGIPTDGNIEPTQDADDL